MMELIEILNRPIAYHRAFVPFGGVTGAVLLSQALYWSNKTNDAEKWFYKSADEWEAETGLTVYEQQTARKRLKKYGVLEEKKRGIPCKLYYRVNAEKLQELLLQTSFGKSRKQACDKTTNSDVEMSQTLYRDTETTTETTHRFPLGTPPTKNGSGADYTTALCYTIAWRWENITGKTSAVVDTALKNRVKRAVEEYGINGVCEAMEKYHTAVNGPYYAKRQLTLFTFLEPTTVASWVHADLKTMKEKPKQKKPGRAANTGRYSGAF